MRNFSPVTVDEDELSRLAQIIGVHEESISRITDDHQIRLDRSRLDNNNEYVAINNNSVIPRERVGEIVRNSNAILYTGRTEARGNTEVDSERYEWILANPDECFPRDENIPCWNGKVLEKVEVF